MVIDFAMNKLGYQYDLVIYGSSANGLALRGDSDLDLSLVIHNLPKFEDPFKQAAHIESVLREVITVIRENSHFRERFKTESDKIQLNSFGYLLQIKDKVYETDIDLSINKIIDPYNSMLIFTYAKLDQRFHKLALVLKYLNKQRFPEKNDRLNSYSIVLILIAFL